MCIQIVHTDENLLVTKSETFMKFAYFGQKLSRTTAILQSNKFIRRGENRLNASDLKV